MKQIFNFFFLLLFISINAQQNNLKQFSTIDTLDFNYNILEFKTPLNLLQCKNCVSENPEIDLRELNSDHDLIQLFKELIDGNSIAFDIVIDSKGGIIEFNPNYTFSYLTMVISDEKFKKLSSKILNKKIISISNFRNNFYKTTLSFTLIDNQIYLNPILH